MNSKIVFFVSFAVFISSVFLLGWFLNDFYDSYKDYRKYDGLHFYERDWKSAKATAESLDEYGDWVCVNVKGMSIDRALEVCRHETGHEIFAEYCEQSEDNFNKCAEVLNETS